LKVEVVLQGGEGSASGMLEPFSMVFDQAGVLYGVEFIKANRVFRMTPDGKVSFIAGRKIPTTEKSGDVAEGDGGPAAEARFNGLHDLCLTWSSRQRATEGKPEDVLLLADTFNHRIRRIDLTTGIVTTAAGTGKAGDNGTDQPATATMLNSPISLAGAKAIGEVWVTDLGNNRVRLFASIQGSMRNIVGNGQRGPLIEGSDAGLTPLMGPRAVAADASSIWIALREGHALVHDLKGTVRTVVNRSGKPGYGGDDGGDASLAQLNGPKYICLDEMLNPVICDTENHVIRRYRLDGNRTELLAGVPRQPGSALGATPLTTQLNRPHGVRWHRGWLYIADSENDRILRIQCPPGR